MKTAIEGTIRTRLARMGTFQRGCSVAMEAGRALSRAMLHMDRDAAPHRSNPAIMATVVLMQLRKHDRPTLEVLLIRICVNGLITPMGELRTASVSPMQKRTVIMKGRVISAVLPACRITEWSEYGLFPLCIDKRSDL